MRRLIGFLCSALLVTQCALATDDPFPRLGGFNIGSHKYDDPVYLASLAKLNIVTVNIWPGWNHGKKMPFEEAVRTIKRINPNARVFMYSNSMEVSAADGAWSPFYRKVDSE